MKLSKKTIRRAVFHVNLFLASSIFSMSAFAGVAGHGVDPALLSAASSAAANSSSDASSVTAVDQSTGHAAANALGQSADTSAPSISSASAQTDTTTTPSISGALNGAPTGLPETQPAAEALPPTEEEIASYFQGAYVVGDSVAYGFQLYANRNRGNSAILQNLGFLTRGSFSAHNAFSAISSKSVHPLLQGTQHHIWDSLQLVGAKHAFLFFGLNDLNIGGVPGTVDYYARLIQQIRTVNPEIEITILSTTPMYQGSEKGQLTNANIDALNQEMQALGETAGWDYLDLATPLKAENGTLAAQYCSDHYVHETNAAYQIWLQRFHDYAAAKLSARP